MVTRKEKERVLDQAKRHIFGFFFFGLPFHPVLNTDLKAILPKICLSGVEVSEAFNILILKTCSVGVRRAGPSH